MGEIGEKCPACGGYFSWEEGPWCDNKDCQYGPFGNYVWPDGYPHLHSWGFQKKKILAGHLQKENK